MTEGPEVEPSVESPREAVRQFNENCRARQLSAAADRLDIPVARRPEREVLAARLRAVMERRAPIDLDRISDQPQGNLADGLAPSIEKVGVVRAPEGDQPLRMSREATTGRWRFSRSTVTRIDEWYLALPDHWQLAHLPQALLENGPGSIPRWQWLGAALALLVSLLCGSLASRLLRGVLASLTSRTRMTWDDRLLTKLRGPITLGCSLGFARGLLPWLELFGSARAFSEKMLHGALLANMLWAFWRLVDATAEAALNSPWTREHHASRALIPLGRRIGKALVAIAACLSFVSALGYSITSLVAGLGIGGLALALASQKTVENLFGAFSLAVDQPFREGDFVRIDDLVGTVEALGLRSTRIRTLDRTLVSIPNGKLAETRLETFAVRDRLRLACTLGLEYGTDAARMRTVLAELERVLRTHPKIWPDTVIVCFKGFAASSLDIEIMAWFAIGDWGEFLRIRQDVLLEFMEVVESSGCSFAFPTQTIHVSSSPKGCSAQP